MISAKFGSNWLRDFREEDFFVFDNFEFLM